MKVLISGAGIAGLTTAYWLKQYGFTVTIVERVSHLLTDGYKLDIRGAALHVLQRMGIDEAIRAASAEIQSARLIDREGKTLQEMSGDDFGHRENDDVEILRGLLCQILKDQLPDVECIFGDVIQSITQFPNYVQVRFQHHEAREFDLVIGADGLHSNVRRLVFGEESRFSQDLGLYLSVFTVPNYLHLDRIEIQYAEIGRIAALWSARGETDMRACFGFVPPKPVDLHDRVEQEAMLKAVYQDLQWEIPKLLQLMPKATDFYFDAALQIVMKQWSSGRVVLLGDAAYCPSPTSGQGTSLALIGAYILAGELSLAKGNYQVALEQYEKILRPFIEANQALGAKAAKVMHSHERKDIFSWILKQLMRFVPGRLTTFLINRSTQRIQRTANSIELKDY